jgi:alpha-amylase
MRSPIAASLGFALCLGVTEAATSAQWKSRSIYQLLTDRFAAVPTPKQCTDLGDYCGGTFQGIITYLDYIQDMGKKKHTTKHTAPPPQTV